MSPDWRAGSAPDTPRPALRSPAASGQTPDTLPERDRRSSPRDAAARPPPEPPSPLPPAPSRALSRSATNSQESALGASTDAAVTPPASDTSAGLDGPCDDGRAAGPAHGAQLLQLSAIAAAQDPIVPDAAAAAAAAAASRKRMADGEVKAPSGSASPVKGHSRATSAVSAASTAGSSIGELSAELKTRLSYAMVKVSHGWHARSLDEVECLASQAVSPTSSTSTVHRRHGSSASPRLPMLSAAAQMHLARDPLRNRRKSNSPPSLSSDKPALAPPAPIQPLMPGPGSNPRRNSSSRYTPTTLSHSHSASPRTPGQAPRPDAGLPISRGEQDAAESLLFMSSPGNSTLKHALPPSGSPAPPPRSTGARHALPSGPRKALPSQRPAFPSKKAGLDKSPALPPPADSPMDLDSPRPARPSPSRGGPKRRTNGATQHVKAALSLPSGLGLGKGAARKTLRDEDIERMLDRAGAETANSSDDDEIELPRGRRDVAGVMGV